MEGVIELKVFGTFWKGDGGMGIPLYQKVADAKTALNYFGHLN